MSKRLPQKVLKFLRDNPEELTKLQERIKVVEFNDMWRKDLFLKQNAITVKCNLYGCKNIKYETDVMCEMCRQEYKDDPDAFK